jgi:hypothetical protein
MEIQKDVVAPIKNTTYIKVEKDYPIPGVLRRTGKKGRPNIYPFFKMEVGDSFFAEGQSYDNGARGAARAYGRLNNMKFSCRKEKGGIRIWRVE